ncbi:MAG: glucoamylase [Hyphomicrobiales bacterium]|nr:glucoamylase [Hyphomicrobiales bacterium]
MRLNIALRFDYGLSVPWVTRLPVGDGISAIVGADMVVLRSSVPLKGEDMQTVGDFSVMEGERVCFVLTYGASCDSIRSLRRSQALHRSAVTRNHLAPRGVTRALAKPSKGSR